MALSRNRPASSLGGEPCARCDPSLAGVMSEELAGSIGACTRGGHPLLSYGTGYRRPPATQRGEAVTGGYYSTRARLTGSYQRGRCRPEPDCSLHIPWVSAPGYTGFCTLQKSSGEWGHRGNLTAQSHWVAENRCSPRGPGGRLAAGPRGSALARRPSARRCWVTHLANPAVSCLRPPNPHPVSRRGSASGFLTRCPQQIFA